MAGAELADFLPVRDVGGRFTRHSGITLLMEDLNDGLRTPGAIMLGGGNP
ncbi:hypothetical protein ACUOCP_54830, partial [Escherichia sp. R-CC3]